ncbi:DNA-directed DNA polymerase gamma mip1 [Mortierella antarctica]|nr:DNA-directed DNA polymerase gamma mip1 [Mortierella antarctica]
MVQRLMPRHPWRPCQSSFLKNGTSVSPALIRHYFKSTQRPALLLLPPATTKASTSPTPNTRRIYRNFRLMSTLETQPSPMRKNKVDVQMLHEDLHKVVFPKSTTSLVAQQHREPTADMVKIAMSHLAKQGLWGKEAILAPNTAFDLPPLRGNTIEDHFYNLGEHDSAVYQNLATTFAQTPVHPPPRSWAMTPGWTRYSKDGTTTSVPYPQEKMLTFDVETVPALSKYPVMACAMSSEAWYGWVSPWLTKPHTADGRQNDEHLMSFGSSRNAKGQEKILVGHNVGYDRARVLEEYNLSQNGIRYLDTMSLHIAGSGLCTQQRPSWLKYSKAIEREDAEYVHAMKDTTGKYFDVSAVNSLLQVSKFHCGIEMDKAPRNILMEATDIGLIQEHFQDLMTYCGQDVSATHAVYQKTLPKYMATCPHPVSFAGILQMGSSFLTVNEGWVDYLNRCNRTYQEMSQNVESKLMHLAENALKNFEADPTYYGSDPWLSQLDWTVPKRTWFEGIPRVDGTGYRKGQEPRWKCMTKILPTKPQWYRDLWDGKDQRVKISTRQRVAPLLLRLQWNGYPLFYSSLHGWTFRVPMSDSNFTTKAHPLEFPMANEAGFQENFEPHYYRYYRLPHKFGEGANVGNPLAKGYISYFDDNVLSSCTAQDEREDDSCGQLARQALDMNAQCAYWVSARERIEEQFVVWDKKGTNSQMGLPDRGEGTNGIILPQIITMGTVTRRAVEKTWMTASNAKKNRIGSELKSMVEAPAGYKIVGADVDSEELWISSLMGDAQFRMHGATALGWMTLQGTKAAGTDLHSKTAQIMGISRDQAKIFNYGRIYGAGLQFASRLLQQFNTTIDAGEAKLRAANLYTATKGVKQHKGAEYELVHDRPFWHGGTESYMFNSLERTATADDPRTPALGCGITDALKPKHTEKQFMTSRVNWVVQSSGVDYLHLLLVSMNYLIKKYDIQARFMLCVHDEVRYMVKEEDTARATLALQISNLWTRALFSYKLGIHDLPQSVAFFSAVDVDHVFRKEVNMDCLTPTQQKAIPHGTSLTIEDVLELTEGKLGPISKGFKDTATGPIPLELRSSDERRRLQLEAMSESTATTSAIAQRPEDQSQSLFLEAQSLATMKEIKQLIKQRKQEAEVAWQAQLAAERKAAELQATRDDGHDDDGSQGSGGLTASDGPIKPATPEKRRIVRSATAPWRPRAPTGARKWGQVTVQDEDEDEDADEASLKAATKAVEPVIVKPRSMDLVFGEALDAPMSEVLAPLGSTEVMVSDDEDGMTLGAEENTSPKVSRVRMSFDEDLFPPMNDAADAQDVLDRQDFVLTYDDDWTLPTEEWLAYFTKDYISGLYDSFKAGDQNFYAGYQGFYVGYQDFYDQDQDFHSGCLCFYKEFTGLENAIGGDPGRVLDN